MFKYLEQRYNNLFARFECRIGARNNNDFPFPSDQEREETQRTRSLIFLALAVLTARRCGFHQVVVIAENGQLAIHLPLTAARISAFSTHTANPEYVDLIGGVFSKLLNFDVTLTNPFLYSTKAEVVQHLNGIPDAIVEESVSCWKASRVSGGPNHCGFCVPCLVRRVALEANDRRCTRFQRDIFTENIVGLPVDDDGKRNLMEFCEFVLSFSPAVSNGRLLQLFPELQNVPLDPSQAMDMYRRFAQEALDVFQRYPQVNGIL